MPYQSLTEQLCMNERKWTELMYEKNQKPQTVLYVNFVIKIPINTESFVY